MKMPVTEYTATNTGPANRLYSTPLKFRSAFMEFAAMANAYRSCVAHPWTHIHTRVTFMAIVVSIDRIRVNPAAATHRLVEQVRQQEQCQHHARIPDTAVKRDDPSALAAALQRSAATIGATSTADDNLVLWRSVITRHAVQLALRHVQQRRLRCGTEKRVDVSLLVSATRQHSPVLRLAPSLTTTANAILHVATRSWRVCVVVSVPSHKSVHDALTSVRVMGGHF